jgi:hypothetical protein
MVYKGRWRGARAGAAVALIGSASGVVCVVWCDGSAADPLVWARGK